MSQSKPYWRSLDKAALTRLDELAELCELGRTSFHQASANGFFAHSGSEAELLQAATTRSDWPAGPWPISAANPLHQIGLMIGLSASGHLGEMSGLLRTGEVMWSLPPVSRAVVENCGRLFAIYVRPFALCKPGEQASPQVLKQVFAAAYVEILSAAFGAHTLAEKTLALAPNNTELKREYEQAASELKRVQAAYGALFDQASTDVSARKKLKLEDVRPINLTELIDDFVAWMWPDPSQRPAPLYRVLSGLAHSSLDAQSWLYDVEEIPDARRLTRRVPVEHIEYLVLVAALLYQRVLARLVGFYGWSEQPLHTYSEHLAALFPANFQYA